MAQLCWYKYQPLVQYKCQHLCWHQKWHMCGYKQLSFLTLLRVKSVRGRKFVSMGRRNHKSLSASRRRSEHSEQTAQKLRYVDQFRSLIIIIHCVYYNIAIYVIILIHFLSNTALCTCSYGRVVLTQFMYLILMLLITVD